MNKTVSVSSLNGSEVRKSKPKYARLTDEMTNEIRVLPPGSYIDSVAKLIDRFGVSQGTVVHTLRQLQNRGLITRPPGSKRFVVVGFPKSNNCVLNFLLIRSHWSSPDYDAMCYALKEQASRQRIALETRFYEENPSSGGLTLYLRACDGAIVLPASNNIEGIMSQISAAHIPCVWVWESPSAKGTLCVADDDLEVGRMAFHHLYSLGHKEIYVLSSEPPRTVMSRRLTGWEEAFKNAGLKNPAAHLIDCSVEPGKDSIVGSYEKLRRWLFKNDNIFPGTALFCLCWTGALGALRAFREIGIRVPEDVSIITHGGENRLCEFSNPPLTAIQCDVDKLASETLCVLKSACLGDNTAEKERLIKPYIVERQSTLSFTNQKL